MTKQFRPPYPRYRSAGEFNHPTWYFTAYNGAGNASGNDTFGNGDKEWMYDIVTPGFRERSSQGEVIMNPMRRWKRSRSQGVSSYGYILRWNDPAYWYSYSGALRTTEVLGLDNTSYLVSDVGTFAISADEISEMDIEASTKCLSKIGRASTDTWENLAEIKKTLSMLWSPLGSWFRWERKARAAGLELSLANLWLMYRYGIRPLVGSINDIMEAVAKGTKSERVTTRGAVSKTVTSGSSAQEYGAGVLYDRKTTRIETVSVRAMSIDDMVTDWRYQYGFDAKSLMTLPWNLVHYSFVADWFFNVSDLIGALGNAFAPQSLGQSVTTLQVASCFKEGTSVAWPSGYTISIPYSGWAREDVWQKLRRPSLATPGLVVKQDFRFDDVTRIVDAVALVGQQILRRFIRLHK